MSAHEHPMAIAMRDRLHDAVRRVLAGGESESVRIFEVSGYTAPEVAEPLDRGTYLATWGRPILASIISGPGGVSVVLRRAAS